jgi:hypothetical protein
MTDTERTEPTTSTAAHSRRTFLGIAGTGVAGMTGAALLTATPAGAASEQSTHVPAGTAPLVVYVADARTGHLVVMHGEREISIHDRALAARLARVARNGA